MIRIYTTNDALAAKVISDAGAKGYQLHQSSALDGRELADNIDELSVLVFDLTSASLSAGDVVSVLDTLDSEHIPPVLYLLSSAADIEVITQAGSIINQDYAFVPADLDSLVRRLDVLTILGARRRLTMETAITDRLTGLYNRKYFLRRLEEELYRSARYGYQLSAMLADVDFSTTGQHLPEETGNVVMRRIADFLKDRLRKTDIVARYKWDDFAFLLPDISREDSLAVADDLQRKLQRLPLHIGGVELKTQVYIGHVCCPVESLRSAVDVMTALEDCCLAAKHSGQGAVASYSALPAAETP